MGRTDSWRKPLIIKEIKTHEKLKKIFFFANCSALSHGATEREGATSKETLPSALPGPRDGAGQLAGGATNRERQSNTDHFLRSLLFL